MHLPIIASLSILPIICTNIAQAVPLEEPAPNVLHTRTIEEDLSAVEQARQNIEYYVGMISPITAEVRELAVTISEELIPEPFLDEVESWSYRDEISEADIQFLESKDEQLTEILGTADKLHNVAYRAHESTTRARDLIWKVINEVLPAVKMTPPEVRSALMGVGRVG